MLKFRIREFASELPVKCDSRAVATLVMSVFAAAACGNSDAGTEGNIGGAGAGGAELGSGGGNVASGGVPGSGGSGAAAGQAAGGANGVGGGAGSGGAQASGGLTSANGGSNSGGAASAGANSGGVAGSVPMGGTAGSSAGGMSGGGPSARRPGTLVNNYDGARATTVSFDTGWKFHLGDVANAQAPTFDDAQWTALDVPHDWSIGLPFNQSSPATFEGGYLDGGTGWYRKTFTLPAASATQKVFVQFDGVYMDSTVYINGTQVYARPYGYSSFEVDVTAHAKYGVPNLLAVKVVNQTPSSRWYSGSGIYRHTWLKTVNPVRVAYTGTQVTTPRVSSASASVALSVTLQNDATTEQVVTLTSTVRDTAGAETGKATSAATSVGAGKTAVVAQELTLQNPKLWSPDAPNLYSVTTDVMVGGTIVDTYTTPFGVRTLAFDANTGFSINGVKLKINGVCNHHDLGALGAAVNHRALEKRMQMLKEMGANAVRTSHNPPTPELLELADRLGLMVMDEAFDCWYAGKHTYDYGRFFNAWADSDLPDMVSRDRNHPSVIIWSIGNEVPQAGDKTTVARLIKDIRTKDTTRPITQAYAAFVNTKDITGLEDVVGINYAPERYDSVHDANPTYKLVASESSSALRSRGVYNSNNNQCNSYDNQAAGWGHTAETSWKNVNTRPWVAGEFVWTGFDYIGEPTPYQWPSKSSYFGIIDSANFPKDIFYFYQSKWNAAGPAMVHIVPMNWTSWTPGQAVKVMVYTNADSVELFLNKASLGSKAMNAASTGHLEWSVPFATGTLEARASRGSSIVATDTLQTAGAATKLALKPDRVTIAADGRDLSFVEVDILDAQGVLVPQASNTISFTLTGPGALLGLDAGDATNHDSYKGSSHAAFSGKLMAIIQSTAKAGTITLDAAANGLSGSSVSITTAAP